MLGVSLGGPGRALATSGGISGYSGKSAQDCSHCHGTTSGATLAIAGPTTLYVGTAAVYTLTLTGGFAKKGGIDVALQGAGATLSLSMSTGNKLLTGEVVHSAPGDFVGASLIYNVVVSPTSAGPLHLYAAGLSTRVMSADAGSTGKAELIVDVQVFDAGVPANQPPEVHLTSPADGAIVSAGTDVTLTALASDPEGALAEVEFYAGGVLLGGSTTPPYQLSWLHVPVGVYALTVKATDGKGASTLSAATVLTVVVTDTNQSPHAAILTPTTGSSLGVSRDVAVAVDASDPEGHLARVALFVDGTMFGVLDGAPYHFTLAGLSLGQHDLLAQAVDDLGASGDSAPVKLMISGVQPGSTDVAPLPGCGVVPGGGAAALLLAGLWLRSRAMKPRV